MNSEYKAIMMKANDINMGFSTFKKAKGIGQRVEPIKFKHKFSGKFKDPIEANKKFFRSKP